MRSLTPLIEGRSLEAIIANMSALWREITGGSQLRWIGADKGAIHLATAAPVNAVWDLWAKRAGKPIWKRTFVVPPCCVKRSAGKMS